MSLPFLSKLSSSVSTAMKAETWLNMSEYGFSLTRISPYKEQNRRVFPYMENYGSENTSILAYLTHCKNILFSNNSAMYRNHVMTNFRGYQNFPRHCKLA